LATRTTTDGVAMFPTVPVSGSGELCGIPFLPSDGLDDGDLWLIDASAIAAGSDTIALVASREASIEMANSALAQDATTGTGAALVSMWQTNSVALKCEASLAAEVLRPDSIARITGTSWGA